MPHDDVDALCARYLDDLERRLAGVPSQERGQIVEQVAEHIATARSTLPVQSEAAVRQILESLGTAEEIAAAAITEEPAKNLPAYKSRRRLIAAAVVLVVLGVGIAALGGAFSSSTATTTPKTTAAHSVVVVPSVTREKVSLATEQLSKLHFVYSVTYTSTSSVPAGTVLAQSPRAGTRISPTSGVVQLTVSGPVP